VLIMAELDHGGDVDAILKAAASEYQQAITHRRPEEILHGA
jgi:hypothetical protein